MKTRDGLEGILESVSEKAAAVETPADYYQNGLLMCGKCHTPKQCVIDWFGQQMTVYCICECGAAEDAAQRERLRREEQLSAIRSLRVQGIQDRALQQYTFCCAEPTRNILRCRKYAGHWDDMQQHNNGLLFWGGVGTGKTFAAACIANALIDRGIPVLMTSFPKVLNSGWDKSELVGQMKRFPLLVLDDLGVERESEYALEIVQFVVDERYKTQLPLIVTTNLTKDELEHPKNMRFQRIYDRILEMCVPVYFDGVSRRKIKATDKMRYAKEVFG